MEKFRADLLMRVWCFHYLIGVVLSSGLPTVMRALLSRLQADAMAGSANAVSASVLRNFSRVVCKVRDTHQYKPSMFVPSLQPCEWFACSRICSTSGVRYSDA